MHIPLLPTVIFFCFMTFVADAFTRLKFHSKREKYYEIPICAEEQSCHYKLDHFQFELCYCPDYTPCPMTSDFRIKFNKIDYQFCNRRDIKTCEPNSIVAKVAILQTSVYCECPEDTMYIEKEGADTFICKEKPFCHANDICNAKNSGVSCQCPLGTICEMSVVNSTCQVF